MSTFKQKSLFAALAGLGVLGVVDSAQAVHINQDGLGQALVYPYYTARSTTATNPYVTALSVVNTTGSAKAVKVRFLEGKNSKEVLDFNLFLSAYDVWTAGIVPAGAGAGIFSKDNSCVSPVGKLSKNSAAPTPFRNGAYTGSGDDGSSDSLDRTYEGYFEMLEMGTIVDNTSLWSAVTHKANLTSPNASVPTCTSLPVGGSVASSLLTIPSGGLMGSASLINVNEGTDFSYDAVALDGWSTIQQWSSPGSTLPTIASAFPATSVVVDNNAGGGRVIITDWTGTISPRRDAVTATMMRSHVYNEYIVDPGLKAATDWVVTMPTKRFYINLIREDPFESFYDDGSCDAINLIYYDREEQTPGSIIDFSPTTPQSRSLCWEANVLTFTAANGSPAESNVLKSKNYANVGLDTPWISGWADLSFPVGPGTVHTLAAPNCGTTIVNVLGTGLPVISTCQNATYFGLPVVGFAVQSFTNGAVLPGPVLSNYGGSFIHKYLRTITADQGTFIPTGQ